MVPRILHDGEFEYRSVGGEMHRRPVNTFGLSLWNAAWLVLDHGEEVPSHIRAELKRQPKVELRFD